ncbi:MAG: ABC transporter six-transmembrane domain-containing protein [Pseudomonadota bacterium]
MLTGFDLTIGALLRVFHVRIGLTWAMILIETGLLAFIPLFVGFAIDGLLSDSIKELLQLAALMGLLVVVAVIRRAYDTRVYGTIRVELGKAQVERSSALPVSALNARFTMGRELVDFLEHTLPEAMAAAVQISIAVAILFVFSPALAAATGVAALALLVIYGSFHRRFYRLNGALNSQTEKQVSTLEQRQPESALRHLLRLRRMEVSLSDTEAVLYGSVFVVLFGMILFNLWFAATALEITVGTIFSIISYSWEFVDSALALPVTLQSWSRLSEIMRRLNDVPRSTPNPTPLIQHPD